MDYNSLNKTGILYWSIMNIYIERREILAIEWQLINIGRMAELEKCHLATVIVIINSGKEHKWVLGIVDKNLMRDGVSI